MSDQYENEQHHPVEGMLSGPMTRRQALGRATAAAMGVAGAALIPPWVAAAEAGNRRLGLHAAASGGVTSTHFKQFPPFNPHVPKGPATGLPKAIASNFGAGSAYFIGFSNVLKKSASDRGYSYTPTTYGTDVAKNIDQLNQLVIKGIGALVAQPQDVAGQKDTMTNMIVKNGIGIAYEVTGPSTIQIVADQFAIGYRQGVAAVAWVKKNLGGKAQAVVFDASEIAPSLTPRTLGRIAGLKTGGSGIQLVAKQPIKLLTADEGSTLSATLLQAHPNIDVWLGDDDSIIGVMSTLQAAGKKPSDPLYLSGVNGQANALNAVKQGTLFRADFAFPNGVYEYATGQLCCDYIEGKSVPQLMVIDLIEVSSKNVNKFLADDQNPGPAFKRGIKGYMTYLGNISYQNRTTNYVINAVGP